MCAIVHFENGLNNGFWTQRIIVIVGTELDVASACLHKWQIQIVITIQVCNENNVKTQKNFKKKKEFHSAYTMFNIDFDVCNGARKFVPHVFVEDRVICWLRCVSSENMAIQNDFVWKENTNTHTEYALNNENQCEREQKIEKDENKNLLGQMIHMYAYSLQLRVSILNKQKPPTNHSNETLNFSPCLNFWNFFSLFFANISHTIETN